MKRMIVMGVACGALLAATTRVAAQPVGQMIAYDRCQYDDWGAIVCDVYLMAAGISANRVDGVGDAFIDDGSDPAWSRDGSRLAYAGTREPGVFVLNLRDWSRTKIADGGGSPTWSPDGSRLAVAAGDLYVINADGTGAAWLNSGATWASQPDWSPDGDTIAFTCEIESGNGDICLINADGTGFVRLTSDAAADSDPAFSPDGSTIAFSRTSDGASGIFFMNRDGSGVRSLFDGYQPAWSPDGSALATAHPWQAACNADNICLDYIFVPGLDVTSFPRGNRPAWTQATTPVAWWVLSQPCNQLTCTFDGSGSLSVDGDLTYAWSFGDGTSGAGPNATHVFAAGGTYAVRLTVADELGVVSTRTAAVEVVNNTWPTASFTYSCRGRECTFDGRGSSDPDSGFSYLWQFGDGDTWSADLVFIHTYRADGLFTVSLTVTDPTGGTDTQQQMVTVANASPTASFTVACSVRTCTFDASASSDADGTLTSYAWNFGDGTTGAGAGASHTYATGGTFSVVLTVVDNSGASSTQAKSVTAVTPEMHVGDLDRQTTSRQGDWGATITIAIHSSSHGAISNAVVSGSWNDGSTSACTTNASGQCSMPLRSGIPKKTAAVSYTVTAVTHPAFVYKPADDHDPDGDSNGTSITVKRP